MTPQELEHELETLNGFERWLENQSGTVGYARKDCDCPLYHYLQPQFGDEQLQIARDGIAIGDGRVHHSLLTLHFTRWIDDGRSHGQPVSAYAAKQALKAARKAIAVGV